MSQELTMADMIGPIPVETIIRRGVAKSLGLRLYSTGVPCDRGHDGPRNVCNGTCIICNKTANAKWRCDNADRKKQLARQWYLANTETTKTRAKLYRSENQEHYKAIEKIHRKKNYDKRIAYGRAYYLANSVQIGVRSRLKYPEVAAAQKAYRAERVDHYRELQRIWIREHPEANRVRRQNRRARIAKNGGKHSPADLHLILEEQGYRCVCGIDLTFSSSSTDHVIPITKGGHNGADNIQLLCCSCNSRKQARDMDVWLRENNYFLTVKIT